MQSQLILLASVLPPVITIIIGVIITPDPVRHRKKGNHEELLSANGAPGPPHVLGDFFIHFFIPGVVKEREIKQGQERLSVREKCQTCDKHRLERIEDACIYFLLFH